MNRRLKQALKLQTVGKSGYGPKILLGKITSSMVSTAGAGSAARTGAGGGARAGSTASGSSTTGGSSMAARSTTGTATGAGGGGKRCSAMFCRCSAGGG